MKRGIAAGAAGMAVIAAACAGCSGHKADTGASSSAPDAAGTRLIFDGQPQSVRDQVTCIPSGDNINIGVGDATDGVGAVISNGDPPIVHSVGLGSVNGVTVGFSDAAPNQAGNAGAAVSGESYAIRGTASGVDMSDPQQPRRVTTSFEIDVTCP